MNIVPKSREFGLIQYGLLLAREEAQNLAERARKQRPHNVHAGDAHDSRAIEIGKILDAMEIEAGE